MSPDKPRLAASVKDVARHAGVSTGTVSNVLNRPDKVNAETLARVHASMRELGFVRNEQARQLRAGRSRAIAFVMLDSSNPFFMAVAGGVDDAAGENGLALSFSHTGASAAKELQQLQILEQQRVQGVLITPVDPLSPELVEYAERGTKVVLIDKIESGVLCSVAVDDHLGARLAIEHLIETGHRRVAFIGGPERIGQVRDRRVGAQAAWADAGLNPADLLIVPTETLDVKAGRAACTALSARPMAERPTGIFAANDMVALGVLQHATKLGYKVPDDIAIIGYDDIDFAEAAAVPLTTVRQPSRDLGRTAVELLLQEVSDPDHEHQAILFTPELVVRDSTAVRRNPEAPDRH